jgi:hypothetical protein
MGEVMRELDEMRGYLSDLQRYVLSLNEAVTVGDCQKVMELGIGLSNAAMSLRAEVLIPPRRRGRLYGYLPD